MKTIKEIGSKNIQNTEFLNWKKEMLNDELEDAYSGLKKEKGIDDDEKRYLTDRIRNLKLWLQEFKETTFKEKSIKTDKKFLKWKIEFLKGELEFLESPFEIDTILTGHLKKKREEEISFIKKYIKKLEKENKKQEISGVKKWQKYCN